MKTSGVQRNSQTQWNINQEKLELDDEKPSKLKKT